MGVLRNGLKAALRKNSDKPIEVKIGLPKRRPYGKAPLGSGFAMHPTSHPDAVWNSALSEEDLDETDNPRILRVRYVGLEDMAALLGFDEEDEAVLIDHAAVARQIGRGRYI